MCQQTLFRDRLIPRRGFYVLYYKCWPKEREERVYVSSITNQGGRIRSYFCLYHNHRDKPFKSADGSGRIFGHDMGQYVWTSSSSGVMVPTGWRKMTLDEVAEMKKKLWQFDRKE